MARNNRSNESEEQSSGEAKEQLVKDEVPETFVKYIGPSHIRQFSQEDLQAAGLSGLDLVDLAWNHSNNWIVSMKMIPPGVYDRAIFSDLELVLVDKDGNRVK